MMAAAMGADDFELNDDDANNGDNSDNVALSVDLFRNAS